MAFRGCMGLTGDQIAAIYAQLGGFMNADTQQNITQYYVTVPAQDLDVALRIDSACMADVEDSQKEWAQEGCHDEHDSGLAPPASSQRLCDEKWRLRHLPRRHCARFDRCD